MGRVCGKKIGGGKGRFQPCIRSKVGRGDKISFLNDQWTDGGVLKDQFPWIYSIAQNKGVKICDCYVDVGGGMRDWHVLISRNLND